MPKVGLFLIFIAFMTTGCIRTPNKKSNIIIKPSNQVSSLASLPAGQKACFGVSVTGPGIFNTPVNTCQPTLGVISGFVEQGQSIEAMVPSGPARNVDLYLYLKDTGDITPCPKMGSSFSQTDLNHLYLVGSATNLNLQNQTESVTITMNFPGAGSTIALAMPGSCTASLPNPGYKILSGSTLATGTGYKLLGHAGHTLNNVVLTGTGYQLYIK